MGKGSKKGNKWTAGAAFADLIFHIFISQLCEKTTIQHSILSKLVSKNKLSKQLPISSDCFPNFITVHSE